MSTAEQTIEGTDPDTGKLFEVPRVQVEIDPSDPTVIKLRFSGGIELERGVASDVAFYNGLVAGKNVTLTVECFVAGPKNTHRRDSEGNVDAVVQTKSLIVHSVEGL
jgi:hypothetical protein